MRFLKIGLWVFGVGIAFAIFAWTSSPRDRYPFLAPYVVSRKAGYYTIGNIRTPGAQSPFPVYAVTFQVKGLKESDALKNMPRFAGGLTRGSEMSLQPVTPIDPKMYMGRHMPIMKGGKFVPPPRPPMNVTQITIWRQLRWNEIAWARLTHIGREAFPPLHPNAMNTVGRP